MSNDGRKGKHREAVKSMTYSQKKRAEMPDYRDVYFSHNPGLFGCIWFCAYCKKAIVGRHNVEVDHIVPLDSPMGMNKGFNLVSSCRECNRKKSNNVDGRVAIGYTSKFFDFILYSFQKIFIISFMAVYTLAQVCVKWAVKVLAAPYKTGSFKIALITTVIYAFIIITILQIV